MLNVTIGDPFGSDLFGRGVDTSSLERQGITATELFTRANRALSIEQVAARLGLHKNTVARWHNNGFVPEHYKNDFLRILGLGSHQLPEDQFYTKQGVARDCWDMFQSVAADLAVDLGEYHFIEPSAGCGWFYQALPEGRRIGIDLCPNPPFDSAMIKADYLQWQPEGLGKYIVIGNPPFGLRGHLALQFINHSSQFADMVAFILPQLFESDGKGAPMKRVDKALRLAYSQKLPENSFEKPDGTAVMISTVFQVWTKINHDKVTLRPRRSCKKFIKIYSLSDGGTPSSTRNKAMLDKCDIYLPSTCFNGMTAYEAFEDLPNRRGYGVVIHQDKARIKPMLKGYNWGQVAFRSTNGALNLRSSLIESVLTGEGYGDEYR